MKSFLYTFFKSIVVASVLLSTTVAFAAPGVPDIISYQGRLTNQNGVLLGGTGTPYYFKFSIWDSPTVGNGTRLWPTSAPGATQLTVVDGVFDINIGDTASGYPDVLDYDFQSNDTVYLQVEVSPNGSGYETLGPRPRITSSSTAINAKTLSGLPSTYFLDATNLTNFESRALATPLTGYTSSSGVITASDTLLSAIQKLNGNIGSAGVVSSVFGRTGDVVAQSGDYTTDTVTEATNLYYTDARFDTRFGVKTTSNLTEGSNLYYTDARARDAISVSGMPLEYDNVSGVISIKQADGSTDGYLTSNDWNTFNTKQAAITTGTSAQYLRGDLSLATFPTALSAFTNDAGYISANQAITLSGAITGSGTTSISTTLANSIVGVANLSASGTPNSTTYLRGDNTWATVPAGNVGTVTSFTFTNGGGFTGSVSNATSTPTLSITQQYATGSQDGQLSAADWNTFNAKYDASNPSNYISDISSFTTDDLSEGSSNLYYSDAAVRAALSIVGTPLTYDSGTGVFGINQADGSTDGYLTSTDWNTFTAKESALTFSTGLTRTSNTITSNLSTGISGGQTVVGGTASGENLTLSSTTNATKGSILFGTSAYNESANTLGIGTSVNTTDRLRLADTTLAVSGSLAGSVLNMTQTWNTTGTPSAIKLVVTDTASNANSMLLELQNGNAAVFSVGKFGILHWGNPTSNGAKIASAIPSTGAGTTRGAALSLGGDARANIGYDIFINSGAARTPISGSNGLVRSAPTFSPTSGTGTYDMYSLAPTINQTGGASGITRGIYLNPTLTAAADYRSIESTQGRVVLADTTMAVGGSLAGSLLDMSQTWNTTGAPSAIKLNITNTSSNALSRAIDIQSSGTNIMAFYPATALLTFGSHVAGTVGLGSGNSATGASATNGEALRFTARTTNTQNAYHYYFVSASAINPVAGTGGFITTAHSFTPTSGTAVWNTLNINPTINQTGGASGITRGIYVNPTLTAAADFRAIETVNGNVTFGDTFASGSGSLAGPLLKLNQTWNTTGNPSVIDVDITDTSSPASTSYIMNAKLGGLQTFTINKTGYISFGSGTGNFSRIQPSNPITGSGTTRGTAMTIGGQARASTGYDVWIGSGARTATTGVSGLFKLNTNISPSSGTGEFNMFEISATVNQTGGANGITRGLYINPILTSAPDYRAIETASVDLGNGAAGHIIVLGYNTNATNSGAGSINYLSRTGTSGFVWQDAAGTMRIHTSAPTTANDTAGTVIGAQTSTRDTKQDITDYEDYSDALRTIVETPLHTFRYIREVEGYGENSPLAKTYIGFIADEVDPAFMVGNVIDQVSVNGLLIGAIKEIDIKVIGLSDLETPNTWRESLLAWFGSVSNGIESFMSKKVTTDELCVRDSEGETCLTRSEIDTLLGRRSMSGGSSQTTTPDPAPETEGVPESTDVVPESPSEEPSPEDTETQTPPVETEPVTEPESVPETEPEAAPIEAPQEAPAP